MQAIDADFSWNHVQRFDGAAHGKQAGAKNVDCVDLADRRTRHAPGQRMGADFFEKLFALPGIQDLGIRQAGNGTLWVEDHRSGKNGAGQRTASRFIHSAKK